MVDLFIGSMLECLTVMLLLFLLSQSSLLKQLTFNIHNFLSFTAVHFSSSLQIERSLRKAMGNFSITKPSGYFPRARKAWAC